MPLRREYRNPPLYEAVCEFFFTSTTEQVTLFDEFGTHLRNEFHEDSWTQEEVSRRIVAMDQSGDASFEDVKLQRYSRENFSFIEIDNDYFSIHQKRPYLGWETFKPFVLKAFALFTDLRGSNELEQVAVRFDNRIEWDEANVTPSEWLEIYPWLGDKFPPTFGSFVLGLDLPDDKVGTVRVELSSDESTESKSRFWLNLSHISIAEQVKGDIGALLQHAHDSVEEKFEACLKPALREKFGEIKDS